MKKLTKSTPRSRVRAERTESGDTLIEVLLAIVVLGLASVAVLLAFVTSIAGSSEHRNIATMDTVLRTAAEESISAIQQQSNSQWEACPTVPYSSLPSTLSPPLPTGWTMQTPTVQYWNGSTFSSTACVANATNPQINSPQKVTITVTSPAGVMSSPLSFVVDDPSARPVATTSSATSLVFVVSPGNTVAGASFTSQPEIEVEGAGGAIVSNDFSAVTLSITPNTGTAGAALSNTCSGAESNGYVDFTGCSISTSGTGYTLTATDPELSGQSFTSAPFNITAGAASQLSFSPSAPGPGTAGSAIPSVSVQALDSYGNLATSATGSVTMSIASGSPQSSFTSGSTSVAFSNGSATFSTLVVDTSGTYTLTATPVGMSGVTSPTTSSSFVVAPGPATSFAVSNPGAQTAGIPFNETITAADAYGNVATSYTGLKGMSFSGPATSPSPDATIPVYPASVLFTSGVGTASVTLFDAQSTSLTAAQSGITGSSGNFTVALSPTTIFNLATPATQRAGTAFNEALTATDPYGNMVTSYTGIKSLSFTGPFSSPSPVTPPSYPSTVSFTAGVGSATGIILYDAQSTALTATQGSVTGTSASFTVIPATVLKLAFNPVAPGNSSVEAAIPNVVVQVVDNYGNVSTTSTGSVGLAIHTPTSSQNTLSGTNPVALSGGVATFSNLAINNAGTYTLGATPSGISGVTTAVYSGSFTIAKVAPTDVVTNTSPVTLGGSVTFTSTVAGPTGGTTPTGTVSWSVGGTAGVTGCTTPTTLVSGVASCTLSVSSAGTYVVSSTYTPGSDPNYLTQTSSQDSVSVGFTPNLLQVESYLGGTAGKIQSGDQIGVTFPVAVTAGSICPGQTGAFVINGTVTVANETSGNDRLYFTPATSPTQCTGNVTGFASNGTGTHAGYIDLGSPSFVTSNATFTSSTLSFNPVTNNIQVTLGGSNPGGGLLGTVKTATATYYPDSAIQSTTGVSVSGSVTATTILTVLQPSAVSIASLTASPNGTPSSGDQIAFTYSEPMDPSSILSTWNGSSTSVIACFGRAGSGSTQFGVATTTGCTTSLVSLGTVSLGDANPYYVNANTIVTMNATMSMATVNGQSVVTVTLGSGGAFNVVRNASSLTWTPSTNAADLAGNGLSSFMPPNSSSKENFGRVDLTAAKLTRLHSIGLLWHLARIV